MEEKCCVKRRDWREMVQKVTKGSFHLLFRKTEQLAMLLGHFCESISENHMRNAAINCRGTKGSCAVLAHSFLSSWMERR